MELRQAFNVKLADEQRQAIVMNNKPSDAAVINHSADTQTSTDNDLLRQRVEKALEEADSPDAEWVSQEEVEADWAVKRAEYLKRADEGKT